MLVRCFALTNHTVASDSLRSQVNCMVRPCKRAPNDQVHWAICLLTVLDLNSSLASYIGARKLAKMRTSYRTTRSGTEFDWSRKRVATSGDARFWSRCYDASVCQFWDRYSARSWSPGRRRLAI